jgi:hypothetical protein
MKRDLASIQALYVVDEADVDPLVIAALRGAAEQEINGPVQRAWPQAFEITWDTAPQPLLALPRG